MTLADVFACGKTVLPRENAFCEACGALALVWRLGRGKGRHLFPEPRHRTRAQSHPWWAVCSDDSEKLSPVEAEQTGESLWCGQSGERVQCGGACLLVGAPLSSRRYSLEQRKCLQRPTRPRFPHARRVSMAATTVSHCPLCTRAPKQASLRARLGHILYMVYAATRQELRVSFQ